MDRYDSTRIDTLNLFLLPDISKIIASYIKYPKTNFDTFLELDNTAEIKISCGYSEGYSNNKCQFEVLLHEEIMQQEKAKLPNIANYEFVHNTLFHKKPISIYYKNLKSEQFIHTFKDSDMRDIYGSLMYLKQGNCIFKKDGDIIKVIYMHTEIVNGLTFDEAVLELHNWLIHFILIK